MDRPIKITGYWEQTIDHAKNVMYGAAGEVTSMNQLEREIDDGSSPAGVYYSEQSSFNLLAQMTRRTTTGSNGTAADLSYNFSATQNNGRITSRKNWYSGEEVLYQYDSLNRLISASVSGSGGWGQSFSYDGFGNLWTQSVTKGTAPSVSLNLQMATNRINSTDYSYDLNGNTTGMPAMDGGSAALTYDVDNRLVSWLSSGNTEEYGYLPDNKRVWKKAPDGTETVYFYGAGGEKLMTFGVVASPLSLTLGTRNVYFGGKLIRADDVTVVTDRLGSVMARTQQFMGGIARHDYFPYGEEIGTASAGNQDKFGTYYRDAASGLDYADQRYFGGLQGRFLTSDPYEASGGAAEPGSWNRYPYVGGDPVNYYDPGGLQACSAGVDFCVTGTGNMPSPQGGGSLGGGGKLPTEDLVGIGTENESGGWYPDLHAQWLQGLVRKGMLSDCQAMTAFASQSAYYSSDRATFVQSFAVFIDQKDEGVVSANNYVGAVFGRPVIAGVDKPVSLQQLDNGQASGYLGLYLDNSRHADQGHHLAAYLQLGYNTNALVGVAAAILRDFGNPGDQTLGNKAVALGLKLGNPNYSLTDFVTELSQLCDRQWTPNGR